MANRILTPEEMAQNFVNCVHKSAKDAGVDEEELACLMAEWIRMSLFQGPDVASP